MNIKEFLCNLRAIPFWVCKGFNPDYFRPHLYRDVGEYPAKIYVNQYTGKFRIADSYAHEFGEKYEPNAIIIGKQCVRCGKITADYKLPRHRDNVGVEDMSRIWREEE